MYLLGYKSSSHNVFILLKFRFPKDNRIMYLYTPRKYKKKHQPNQLQFVTEKIDKMNRCKAKAPQFLSE